MIEVKGSKNFTHVKVEVNHAADTYFLTFYKNNKIVRMYAGIGIDEVKTVVARYAA